MPGVYWIGANGNAYYKAQSGGAVQDYGRVSNYNDQGFDSNQISMLANRIADPNPPPGRNLRPVANNITSGYVAPARAAYYDIEGNSRSAYRTAQRSTNALYDKYLNIYLAQQKNALAKQQNIYSETTTALDTAQKNLEEANKISGERTSEDVALNTEQINKNEDEFQIDSGSQNAVDRIQLAREASASGGGGQAAAKVAGSEEAHATTEGRQVAQFGTLRAAQSLLKARTFEDLATSSRLGGEKTAVGKKSAKFDIDNYITAAKLEEKQYRLKDQETRNKAIIEERDRIAREKYNKFLRTISDPGVVTATATKYGSSF